MAMAAVHAYRAGSPQPPRGLGWLDRRPALAWLGAAAVLWLAAIPLRISDQPAAGWSHAEFALRHLTNTAIALARAAAAGSSATRPAGLLRRLLATPGWLLWLGMVSYGIYLYHLLVIGKLADWRLGDAHVLHPYLRLVRPRCWPAALLFAAASWYCLERPLAALPRCWSAATRPDPHDPQRDGARGPRSGGGYGPVTLTQLPLCVARKLPPRWAARDPGDARRSCRAASA